jgi:hypothetical protein
MDAIAVRNQARLEFNRKCKSGEPKPHPEHAILQLSSKNQNQLLLLRRIRPFSIFHSNEMKKKSATQYPKFPPTSGIPCNVQSSFARPEDR